MLRYWFFWILVQHLTVSHDVLLDRLHNDVGLRGNALNWFYSYRSQRSQRVSIHGTLFHKAPVLDLYYSYFTRLSYLLS